jgi:hypothetical protein
MKNSEIYSSFFLQLIIKVRFYISFHGSPEVREISDDASEIAPYSLESAPFLR